MNECTVVAIEQKQTSCAKLSRKYKTAGDELCLSFRFNAHIFEIRTNIEFMSELSLAYYVSICKGDVSLLQSFKTLLLEDIKSMEVQFFVAAQRNDVTAMRRELHKLYPIASNLNFLQMLELIERYRHSDPSGFPALHGQFKTYFVKIYELLQTGDDLQ